MRSWLKKFVFNFYYLGSPPWDTGITPPELREFIDTHPPGRALDLGCGTGTNVISLSRAGWQAVGVDFSGRAIRIARAKARRNGIDASFWRDDVTRLKDVAGTFHLIVDIGCFHAIPAARHNAYAKNILAHLAPGGTFMLYVFFREQDSPGTGTTEDALAKAFAPLKCLRREDGTERGQRHSAWLWYAHQDRADPE